MEDDNVILIAYLFLFSWAGLAIGVMHLLAAPLPLRYARSGFITSLVVALLYLPVLGLAQGIAGWADSEHRTARIALLLPLAIVVWTVVVWVRTEQQAAG